MTRHSYWVETINDWGAVFLLALRDPCSNGSAFSEVEVDYAGSPPVAAVL